MRKVSGKLRHDIPPEKQGSLPTQGKERTGERLTHLGGHKEQKRDPSETAMDVAKKKQTQNENRNPKVVLTACVPGTRGRCRQEHGALSLCSPAL